MASSSSSSSTSRIPVQKTQQQEDRLDALPDHILLHILSFLPTLDAVRTSVLSTRWRTLWTSVGALDLDEEYDRDFFFCGGTGKRTIRGTKRNRKSFVEFSDKVLSFHQTPSLHKLRLICLSKNCPLTRWVRKAVSRRVQTLDLRLPSTDARRLPSLLFSSPSLVDLRLDLHDSALILPETMALVGLRHMRLSRVQFCDHHSLRTLFSSSTALRSLALENCYYRKLGCLEISCCSLQELAIQDTTVHYTYGLGSCRVKIVAPKLSHFVYRAYVAQAYVVEPLLCLEYVKIEFQRSNEPPMLDQTSSFLCSLSSARNVDICPACVQDLLWNGVPFCNLNVLRTTVDVLDYWALLVVLRLLILNPHLRALIVEVRHLYLLPSSGAEKEDFLELLRACFESENGVVEKVEIRCIDSTSSREVIRCTTETVLELLRVLLGSQACLKKLILSNRFFCDRYSPYCRLEAVMEKVLSFPKRSSELLAVAFI